MDVTTWQATVHQRLTTLARDLRTLAPGTLYGMLSASTILPVVAAVQQGDYGALVALTGVVGGVGGNLIANQIQAWKDQDEQSVAADLTAKAQTDAQWRDTLDKLIASVEAPRIVQAILSEADKDWFADTLRSEIAQLGSGLTIAGDFVAGDFVGGDKVGGDKSERDLIKVGNLTNAENVAIGKSINQTHIARADKVEFHAPPTATDQPTPTELRTAYLQHLFQQANLLALGGVDPRAATAQSEARLSLGAVYTALLTLTQEQSEHLPSARHENAEPRRLSAVAQLNQHAQLVLLGDPGSGKSTFVNFVVLCLAGEALAHAQFNLKLLTAPLPDDEEAAARDKTKPAQAQPWRHKTLLPVRVVLRDFAARGLPQVGAPASADHLWRFIQAELTACTLGDYAPHLRQALLRQGGLLLLDGLDEVPDADRRRAQIQAIVKDFSAVFPRCRILVTSRTYAYQQQDWRLAGFAEALLAPFSDGQIRRFIKRWYTHMAEVRGLNPADAQGRGAVLQRAIFASARLRELAERPLLLTLTASLHAWRGGSLPERREELYAAAVDLLLDWWESQRVVRDAAGNIQVIQPSLVEWLKVDRGQVRGLLNRLAYTAHASQPTLVGTADIAEPDLVYGLYSLRPDPAVSLDELVNYLSERAGLLTPRGVGVYTFPHRTFQEYLAACHLTGDEFFPEKLADLARSAPARWREVALLAGAKASTGTTAAIWALVDALCFRDPTDAAYSVADAWGAHLAGQALVESIHLAQVSARNQGKVERVRRGLLHALTNLDLPARERAHAGRTLATLGDPRSAVLTIEDLEFCHVPAGPFLMGEGEEAYEHDLPYPYWISRFPITNAQFSAFVEAEGYADAAFWPEAIDAGFWKEGQFKGRWDNEPRRGPYDDGEPFTLPNHPVVSVTWYEALAFTRWLTAQLKHATLLPTGYTVQLPNEPEWEKAARGGVEVPDPSLVPARLGTEHPTLTLPKRGRGLLVANTMPRRVYPWGDELTAERANYDATQIGASSAVGCFPGGASPYGVEELKGNVWEWTRSLWSKNFNLEFPYPYNPVDGRENLTAGADVSRRQCGSSFAVISISAFGNPVRISRGVSPHAGRREYGLRVVVSPFTSEL